MKLHVTPEMADPAKIKQYEDESFQWDYSEDVMDNIIRLSDTGLYVPITDVIDQTKLFPVIEQTFNPNNKDLSAALSQPNEILISGKFYAVLK